MDSLLKSIEDELNVNKFVENCVVMPGDDLTELILPITTKIRIGQGISQTPTGVRATKSGILRFKAPNRFWVENSQRRYVPRVGDAVVGTIMERHAEEYRVNIRACTTAILPALAFDGASKRNKPDLKVGDAVYARVALARRDVEPMLTCCAREGQRKRDWVTGESVYGQLERGTVFRCSLGLATQLRDPDCVVLNTIGANIPFEIVVGSNGIVWLLSETISGTIVVKSAIRHSEHLNDEQTKFMAEKMVKLARRNK